MVNFTNYKDDESTIVFRIRKYLLSLTFTLYKRMEDRLESSWSKEIIKSIKEWLKTPYNSQILHILHILHLEFNKN